MNHIAPTGEGSEIRPEGEYTPGPQTPYDDIHYRGRPGNNWLTQGQGKPGGGAPHPAQNSPGNSAAGPVGETPTRPNPYKVPGGSGADAALSDASNVEVRPPLRPNTYIGDTRGKLAILLEARRLLDVSCLLPQLFSLAVARRRLCFTPHQLVQSLGAPSCSVE